MEIRVYPCVEHHSVRGSTYFGVFRTWIWNTHKYAAHLCGLHTITFVCGALYSKIRRFACVFVRILEAWFRTTLAIAAPAGGEQACKIRRQICVLHTVIWCMLHYIGKYADSEYLCVFYKPGGSFPSPCHVFVVFFSGVISSMDLSSSCAMVMCVRICMCACVCICTCMCVCVCTTHSTIKNPPKMKLAWCGNVTCMVGSAISP